MKEFNIHVENDIKLPDNAENNAITSELEAIDQKYIIKFIIAGSFYPNYFKTEPADPNHVIRTLNAKNPKTTVAVWKCIYSQTLLIRTNREFQSLVRIRFSI